MFVVTERHPWTKEHVVADANPSRDEAKCLDAASVSDAHPVADPDMRMHSAITADCAITDVGQVRMPELCFHMTSNYLVYRLYGRLG